MKPICSIAPDGTRYRDLNGNGVMDPYEDPRRPTSERVADLLGRLSLTEKAGLMMQPVLRMPATDGEPLTRHAHDVISRRFINHFNVHALASAHEAAEWINRVQAAAERTPHGIPVTISTDPRHGFIENSAVSFNSGFFSQWPEPLGLAALRDPAEVGSFADIARQEYLAVGIRAALHPSVDLPTEPRWGRQAGTFGFDADLSSELVRAYLRGFQTKVIGPDSVACTTKHFPGGGPQKDGEDPHFPYGREQVYPGGNFEYHLAPFRAAIDAGTAAMMPYYAMPIGLRRDGVDVEPVGFGFNRQIVADLLRTELGYDGVVVTDWGLVTESALDGRSLPARAWGVEHLDELARVRRILDAGCDQLGGESEPAWIVELVDRGLVGQDRIDASVTRLLAVKFHLGLFDDPYVDEIAAALRTGTAEFRRAGDDAQARSVCILADTLLPLASGTRVYAVGYPDAEIPGLILVDDVDAADVALVRIDPPFDDRDDYMLEAMFHQGTLEVAAATIDEIRRLAERVPVIVEASLDRPTILTGVVDHASTVVATFGVSLHNLARVLTGEIAAIGQLPFELPRSIDEILQSPTDLPGNTPRALFRYGAGNALSREPIGVPLAAE